eukprot:TRINITY_DN8417_c0_g1_i1.p2 TRINITY_DN8417_c0_g1~~TRINITY_DN8417_c0_g1_i1.p2  ORF type:complete len:336 (-),score=29.03 TRINITY_DN8417_c0_g1_i1:343-1350(-)
MQLNKFQSQYLLTKNLQNLKLQEFRKIFLCFKFAGGGDGSYTSAGNRITGNNQMCGNCVMFEEGKILCVGGSEDYNAGVAQDHATLIDINNAPAVSQTNIGPMIYARVFHSSCILPDGKVLVTGGVKITKIFTDARSILHPELIDPVAGTFTKIDAHQIPRTYHSVAFLLPSGKVVIGGGGLCGGCDENHYDVEVITPPYLTDGKEATRPVISSISDLAPTYGDTLTVNVAVESGRSLDYCCVVRPGSMTHGWNSDQRRLKCPTTGAGPSYSVTMPTDSGVALPGPYMLFCLDTDGVPSVGEFINLTQAHACVSLATGNKRKAWHMVDVQKAWPG